MRDVAPVVLGGIGVMPYTALGSIHADPVDPMPGHEAAALLRELPEEAVETLLAYAGPDAAFTLMTIGVGVPPVVDAVAAHAGALLAAMGPWSSEGGLPNLAASGDRPTVAARYDATTYARLGTLVATCDPHQVLVAGDPFRPG